MNSRPASCPVGGNPVPQLIFSDFFPVKGDALVFGRNYVLKPNVPESFPLKPEHCCLMDVGPKPEVGPKLEVDPKMPNSTSHLLEGCWENRTS